ncbi:uncharacterized protein LOC125885372 [Epinephelus fuscoguttatus]|uniref:uncharacterized protein LOC125885372 n=1 Tax=Epinephelus fuscoguttatus TaxID=293821 RepID=UPI0020D05A43|nr:uncharacterized protein LOC125885372 [Epinephelus fuscoguttatus]
MSLTAAASGFVIFPLSVQVIQGQDDWGVTYTSTKICAVKGSTVEIHCSYTYPSRIMGSDTTVEETFWFTNMNGNEPVDLRKDPQCAGRVQDHCENNICTLRITDLRESNSAVYKFRFITNQAIGYTGSPGVTLSVAGLQVQVSSHVAFVEQRCQSSCPEDTFYVWYKNKQKIGTGITYYLAVINPADTYYCAVKGNENFPSPSVCKFTPLCHYTELTLQLQLQT